MSNMWKSEQVLCLKKLYMLQFWETDFSSYRNKSHKTGLSNLFWGHLPKFPTNFEEIIPRAHENFEEQNKVLGSFIIITNYWIITINTIYNNMYN